MFARPVEDHTLKTSVLTARSPLNSDVWQAYLALHPDREFANTLLDYILHGAPLGYKGPRTFRVHKNWSSVYKFQNEVKDCIDKDVRLGRKAGPFPTPPLKNFVGSPMGAFLRKHSNKIRVIHDLSWPPTGSVNDFIAEEECKMQYITLDTILDHVRVMGKNVYQCKLDLADAFKHCIVRPSDWDLLGSTWTSEIEGKLVTEFYIEMALPFGCSSSPKIFDKYASGLKFIMQYKGASIIEKYLDDYYSCAPTQAQCSRNLEIMLDSCRETGFMVNHQKISQPNKRIEFLGIIIDTSTMRTEISPERLQEVMFELSLWYNRRSCTKRQLLSLIGKLTFVSRVVRHGRTFVRRLIQLSKRAKYLHYKITLNSEARADISWWQNYLPTWNGISIIDNSKWLTNTEISLETDASDLAVGCVYPPEWFYVKFEGELAYMKNRSINWRELYAIVKATATWCASLRGKKVIFLCDNLSVVYILQNGCSKDPAIMILVRALFFIAAQYQIEYTAKHIPGVNNTHADNVSRLKIKEFLAANTCVNREATSPTSFTYEGISL
jgi:hypothetical protein